MKGPFRNKQGSSLLEVVVSIAILGLVVAPVCASLVLSHRLNADSEELLQARLLVESTVEQLMAEGMKYELDETASPEKYVLANEGIPDGVAVYPDEFEDPNLLNRLWYNVVVEYGDVTVSTIVRAAPVSDAEGGGSK